MQTLYEGSPKYEFNFMGVWEGYEYWRAEDSPDGFDYVIFYHSQHGRWYGGTDGLPTPETVSISTLFSAISRNLFKIFDFRLIKKIF